MLAHGLNDRGSWLLVALLLFGVSSIPANLKTAIGLIDACQKPAILNGAVNCEGEGSAVLGLSMLLGTKIDLNTASLAELKQIPKLSSKVALAIIEKRMNLGSLSSYSQIDEIKGVGLKTLENIKKYTVIQR